MIVYNVTIKIAPRIEEAWLQWQMEEHIPEIMSTGLFREWRMFRLLEHDNSEGSTYVVQYYADNIEKYECYVQDHAPGIRKKIIDKWGDQFIAFRTVMELVN